MKLKDLKAEGGHAVVGAGQINTNMIDSTLSKFMSLLKQFKLIDTSKTRKLGSTKHAHKIQGTVSDIDIAVFPRHEIGVKEFKDALIDFFENGKIEARPVANTVSVKFPVFDENWDESGQFVQIDLFVSAMGTEDWRDFKYTAPEPGTSKFKGANRTALLIAAMRSLGYSFGDDGLYQKIEIGQTKFGTTKYDKKFVTSNPQQAIDIIFGKGVTNIDELSSYEGVMRAIDKSRNLKNKKDEIVEKYNEHLGA